MSKAKTLAATVSTGSVLADGSVVAAEVSGLGTAATTDASAYATAAQGAKADTALQSESDPVYTASSWYSTTNNASNWNTAYGWGNHASAGYQAYDSNLTSFVSTFTLPTTDGTADQVLKTDGSGNLTFATPSVGFSSGKAYFFSGF